MKFREKQLRNIKPVLNETAVLQRESKNPYDFYAIKVLIRDTFIGYLPAHENIALANLMDAGAQLTATVSKVNLNNNRDHYLREAVAIKVSTRLLVPIHKIIQPKKWQQSDDAVDVYRKGPDLLPDGQFEE